MIPRGRPLQSLPERAKNRTEPFRINLLRFHISVDLVRNRRAGAADARAPKFMPHKPPCHESLKIARRHAPVALDAGLRVDDRVMVGIHNG